MVEFAPTCKRGVDNFFSNDFRLIISALLGFPAFILVTAATNGGRWSNANDVRFGLNQFCWVNSSLTCCGGFSDTFGTVPGWIGGTYAFMIMASVAGCLTFILAFVTMCVTSCSGKRKYLAPALSIITAFLLMISIAIYGDNMYSETWSKDTRMSGSFVAAIIASVLYLLLGIVSCIGINNNAVGDSQLYPPKNWTNYTNTRSLKDWININQNAQVNIVPVDITLGDEGKEIKRLFIELWKKRLPGKERDAAERGYREVAVKKIERIENPVLLEKYMESREKLLRHKKTITPIQNIHSSRSDVLTTSHLKSFFLERTGIDCKINEHYVFHGCPENIAPLVTNDGLDLRLAKSGLLGRGTYGAEDPTKSDQYAGLGFDNKKMFLMRILLGNMFPTNCFFNFQLPPCKRCIETSGRIGICSDNTHRDNENWTFDSVLYDNRNEHREFIVYDQNKCYPEYLITYDRIPN